MARFLKKITSPLLKKVQVYKKRKYQLEIKQKREIENEKKTQSNLRKDLLQKEIREEKVHILHEQQQEYLSLIYNSNDYTNTINILDVIALVNIILNS